jgi:PLD-like domain
MRSASYIASEPDFRKVMTTEFNSTLANKSSSPSNTLRTVEQMFDAATQVCHNSNDRDVVNWLRTCVLLAVKQGFDETGASPSKPKSSSSSSAVKRKSKKYEEDGFIVPDDADKIEHAHLGASDDDYDPPSDDDDDEYVPTDEDAVVPDTKPSKPSSPRGKRGSGQKSATKSTKIPEDGLNHSRKAGEVFPSKDDSHRQDKQQQIQKYHQMSFPKGNFVQSYFFPSKESYSAFLSALNSARSTLDICVFSITDDDTADALIAAKKRGVKIRIITDDQQAAIKGADAARLQKDYGIPYKTDHT